MLVYGFIGDESKFIEIDGSLQSMQNFVGGLNEKVGLQKENKFFSTYLNRVH